MYLMKGYQDFTKQTLSQLSAELSTKISRTTYIYFLLFPTKQLTKRLCDILVGNLNRFFVLLRFIKSMANFQDTWIT